MKTKAFTLIELLIVVAIIAILAAIAVPNFLEAQTRSKVSRVKADMRSIATALEAYQVDNNRYAPNDAGGLNSQFRMNKVVCLTTPVAYMTSLPRDPFVVDKASPGANLEAFQYFNYDRSFNNSAVVNFYGQSMSLQSWGSLITQQNGSFNSGQTFDIKGAVIKSYGPDAGKIQIGSALPGDAGAEWSVFGTAVNPTGTPGINMWYDPTNGTISIGDIVRFVGAVPLPQVPN